MDNKKVFLYNAAYLIGIGCFGAMCWDLDFLLSNAKRMVSLDPILIVTTVPIAFDVPMIAAINIGTFVICLLMLLIPSFIISKVTPIRALRRV